MFGKQDVFDGCAARFEGTTLDQINIAFAFAGFLVGALVAGCATAYSRGTEAFNAGRYDEAAREFEAAVKAGTKRLKTLTALGIARYKIGDSAGAVDALRRVLVEDSARSRGGRACARGPSGSPSADSPPAHSGDSRPSHGRYPCRTGRAGSSSGPVSTTPCGHAMYGGSSAGTDLSLAEVERLPRLARLLLSCSEYICRCHEHAFHEGERHA